MGTATDAGKKVEEWSEVEVLRFLEANGLLGQVDVGLLNGAQLSVLSLTDCEKAAKGNRKAVGAKLFKAIQCLKNGKTPNKLVDPDDPYQYHRLEEVMFSEEHDLEQSLVTDDEAEEVDPDKHGFPPLFECPSAFSASVIVLVLGGSVLVCTVFKEFFAKIGGFDTPNDFVYAYLRYSNIPILMVPFTYAHIWAALWMTFYPIKFVGCWQIPGTNVGFPIGWQGIVPFKCVKMAKMAVRMLTEKLLKVEEVFSRLDPGEFAKVLEPEISKKMSHVVDEIAMEEAPRLWKLLPTKVKEQVFYEAGKQSPVVVDGLVNELQTRIDDCFDLEGLVVAKMTGDMELSNNMFIQCADRELAFIRNSGAWMGGLFGLGQMVISIYYRDAWVLPVVGLVAGAITNWIALLAIFSPVNPIRLCNGRIVLQGLFLTRQAKVSALYGHIVQRKILTAENLNRELMQGARSQVTREIAKKHIRMAFEKSVVMIRSGPLAMTMPSSLQDALDRIGDKMSERMADDMYEIMRHGEAFMDRAFDLENTLRTRMRALPPRDFERLLHPIFEEDEFKLVICGGALGAVFGIIQAKLIGF